MASKNQDCLKILITMREEANWQIQEQRDTFFHRFYPLAKDWYGQLPNLRDFFHPEQIDWLLAESVKRDNGVSKPDPFIEFVIETGYRDEPVTQEDGKPSTRRTTAIHHSTKAEVVNSLFEIYNRFDVNYTDEAGLTHFHVACRCGLKDVVAKFLEFGRDIVNCLVPATGDSPLQLALIYDEIEVAKLLLSSGADPSQADVEGLTPLHIACKRYDDVDLVKLLLESSDEKQQQLVRIDALDKQGRTPLHCAMLCDNKNVSELLLRRGADPNVANAEGSTALHIVCEYCHNSLEFAEMLLKIGGENQRPVHIDAQDKAGRTPLHVALSCGRMDLIRMLLRNGADPNLADADGHTPLHAICKENKDDGMARIFFSVTDNGQRAVDVNARDKSGNTPLQLLLAQKNHPSELLIELLLGHGADPNVANAAGSTPLHIICPNRYNDDFLEVFFKMCVYRKRPVEVNARDKAGNTPLHLTMVYGLKNRAEILLRNGADPNLGNAEGLTTLHIICKDDHDDSDLMKAFFEINDKLKQTVQVDAVDNLGWTPLQWAVANFSPRLVDLLLDRGAELSKFAFPTEVHIDVGFELFGGKRYDLKIKRASGALAIVENLEKKGYEMTQSVALTIMQSLTKHGLFEMPTSLRKKPWYNDARFTSRAKKIMMKDSKPGLTLYDLTCLKLEEAAKLLTHTDCMRFANSNAWSMLPEGPRQACFAYLCETLLRGFFRRWTLDYFLELTSYRFPVECGEMIIAQLMNKDLCHVCLAAAGQS